MSGIAVRDYTDFDSTNAVAIVGFPSLGLVSSIAASFLVKELGLELVSGMTSPSFPPYAIIQGGRPVPQVRMYAGCRELGDDRGMDCDSLVVIVSEFMPKAELLPELGDAVTSWCEGKGIRTVVTLDGIPQFEPDEYAAIGVGSTDNARRLIERYGIPTFDEGMVRGLSGTLLLNGERDGLDVITILGSARSDMPDPKGAAKLMEPLTRMLPELQIDTEPLYKEAAELDKKLRSQPSADEPGDRVLYG